MTAGCSNVSTSHSRRAPAPLMHVVLFDLVHPSDSDELIESCNTSLPRIQSVVFLECGTHVDMGRSGPAIQTNYDVALIVGFRDRAGYLEYLDHPVHTELVHSWRERWDSIRIYDFSNPMSLDD